MNRRVQILVVAIIFFTFFSLSISLFQLLQKQDSGLFKKKVSASQIQRVQKGIAKLTLKGIIQNQNQWEGIYADGIVEIINEIENSDNLLGLIIELDSPGGEVGATKKIYEALKNLKKKKPVVVYINDIAASGGYYIASVSDRILSREFSLIGSIGVISIQPDLSKLLNSVGITIHVYKSGKYKDMISPFRETTEEEKQMYMDILETAYITFIQDVSEGRKQSIKVVREDWAEGRIFSGKKAKALQMIDDIGGYEEALNTMKILLKTIEDLPVYEMESDVPYILKFLMNHSGTQYYINFNNYFYYLFPDSRILENFKFIRE